MSEMVVQYMTDPVMNAVTHLLAGTIARAVVDSPPDVRLTEYERVERTVIDALIASGVPSLVGAVIDDRDSIPANSPKLTHAMWKVAALLGIMPPPGQL